MKSQVIWVHLIQICNFGTNSISRESLTLQTSNMAYRLITRNSIKMQNQAKSVVKGTHDAVLEFWNPMVNREAFKLETSNLALRVNTRISKITIRSEEILKGVKWPALEFQNVLICRERWKLKTSDFAHRMITRSSVDKTQNQVKGGREGSYVTRFWNIETQVYLGNG